jgi:hypothetical protein
MVLVDPLVDAGSGISEIRDQRTGTNDYFKYDLVPVICSLLAVIPHG